VQKFKKIWGFLFSFENGHSLGEKVKSKVNQLGIERLRLSRINFVDKFAHVLTLPNCSLAKSFFGKAST